MRITLLALLLLPALGLTAAEKKPAPAKDPNCEIGVPPGKFSEKSIFPLNATWTEDTGREMKLADLRGKPIILALFFSNCEHSCQFIVRDMKSIESALPKKARAKVDFLLVSIDPERDSTEALAAFRAKHRLGTANWHLLRAPEKSVRQLADRVGFSYFPGSKTQFAHSLLITVLNGDGETAHQQSGLGVDRKGAVETLEKLVSAKPKP
ncbi:MAG: SCO family protein [Chthoniobacteraceae bacterium]